MIIKHRVIAFSAMLSLIVFSTGSAIAQTTNPGTLLDVRSATLDDTTRTLIPDFDGTPTDDTRFSTVSITAQDLIDAGDNGQEIVDVFFTIEGLVHSHVSDLTVGVAFTPTDPNSPNRAATLFERAGISDPSIIANNQNGNSNFGATANLNGSYRFGDNGAQLFAAAASAADNNEVITRVNEPTEGATIYRATGATDGFVSLFDAFATDGAGNALTLTDIIGTYTFAISDRSNLTTNNALVGVPQSFTETNVAFQTAPTTAIPEPGTATATLLGLIGFAARRRRA